MDTYCMAIFGVDVFVEGSETPFVGIPTLVGGPGRNIAEGYRGDGNSYVEFPPDNYPNVTRDDSLTIGGVVYRAVRRPFKNADGLMQIDMIESL